MGLVDKSDMQISFAESTRKTLKWYKKLFFHFLDMSLYNSFILYKIQTKEAPQLSEFRLKVVKKIIEKHGPQRKPSKGGRCPSDSDNPPRLTAHHFPRVIPPNGEKRNVQRACHVCNNSSTRERKQKDTRYERAECNVGLCLSPCFEEYHTLRRF